MNKTRHTSLLTILIPATLLLTACKMADLQLDGRAVRGSGNVIEETRAVNGVSGVNLATIGHLIIEVGDTESLRIEAEDNLLEYLETEVFNGELRIQTQSNLNMRTTQPVNYYLTATDLDRISIFSSGDIQAPHLQAERFSITVASSGNLKMGDLKADALDVQIFSSGDVTVGALNANMLEINISSSGNLHIAGGEVKTQNITINSSGKYTAQDLASEEAQVRINSSGSATIRVRNHLNAQLKSSGDLRYFGNPAVDAMTNSSGDVIQMGK